MSNYYPNDTLPSSNAGFNSNSGELRMVNGMSSPYSPGSLSSFGSYYNARVANTLTANETLKTTGEYQNNICASNWTLPTKTQTTALSPYKAGFNVISSGYVNGGVLYGTASSYGLNHWNRTPDSTISMWHYNNGSEGHEIGHSSNGAYYGLAVRCVAK